MKTSAIISTTVSWIVVAVIVLGIPVLNHFSNRIEKLQEKSLESGPDWRFEFTGKYSLGATRALGGQARQFSRQLANHAADDEQQIAAAIFAAEVEGKDAAIAALNDIFHPQADDVAAYYEKQVDHLQADSIARHYPWFFKLGEVFGKPDSDPARAKLLAGADKIFKFTLIFGISLIFIIAIGLVLLLLGIILIATDWLKFKTPRLLHRGEVYIESFAIYLALFVAVSVGIALLPDSVPMGLKMIPMGLVVLFAACWPLIRGIGIGQYCKTIGIHRGSGFFMEIFTGIAGYLAGLPLVVVGVVITYFLTKLTDQQTTHPIAFEINQMSPLMLFGLAVVFAPLTEELMFRGIFVSHLRSWSGIIFSSILSGLIFAAIHPQGWVAIPVLGTMGANFALIRQWRDSLIPSIAAHALNNGVVVTLMLVVAR